MRRCLALLSTPFLAFAQAPGFSAKDAVLAEWNRRLPALDAQQLAQLPAADRARYERSLARIGAPGAPDLLPPELAHPTKELWEDLARKARTPQERFTALFFLNRFKAPDALVALDGLTAADAKAWPAHLHLEAQIATARINGSEVRADVQAFLDALQRAGKVDPVRAQAARLRLVIAGKEKNLLPLVPLNAASSLSLLDAFRQAPESKQQQVFPALFQFGRHPFSEPPAAELAAMGIKAPAKMATPMPKGPTNDPLGTWWEGFNQRLMEEMKPPFPKGYLGRLQSLAGSPLVAVSLRVSAATALGGVEGDEGKQIADNLAVEEFSAPVVSAFLPSLRKLDPAKADALRAKLLIGPSAIARAAAIDDLPEAPADLDALAKRCFEDTDLESALELFAAMDRWKLPAERQKAVLTPFLQHPDWGWRYQAYLQLKKVDPATAWPSAPAQRPMDTALLDEAVKLAERGKPVRLRLTFSGRRTVTLKLDPTLAPMNVANLLLLAKKRFFDGHRVPRVVPDFVVQMGSPYDTMDGGPGYSVRCEDSTVWYGPGSVGMALAGKDTGGCQFFITTNATPHLTGKYTRVGEVADPDHDLKILDELELGAKIVSVRVVE